MAPSLALDCSIGCKIALLREEKINLYCWLLLNMIRRSASSSIAMLWQISIRVESEYRDNRDRNLLGTGCHSLCLLWTAVSRPQYSSVSVQESPDKNLHGVWRGSPHYRPRPRRLRLAGGANFCAARISRRCVLRALTRVIRSMASGMYVVQKIEKKIIFSSLLSPFHS
jgi:hypothetical protein